MMQATPPARYRSPLGGAGAAPDEHGNSPYRPLSLLQQHPYHISPVAQQQHRPLRSLHYSPGLGRQVTPPSTPFPDLPHSPHRSGTTPPGASSPYSTSTAASKVPLKPNVFRVPSPSELYDDDEEEEEEKQDEEAEEHKASERRHERRGSPYRRDDADTLLHELEKRRREEVKMVVKANLQSYEEDVRSLTQSFESVLSTLTQDEEQTKHMTQLMKAENEKRERAVKEEMERLLREEEERIREDNRRLAEFTRRKQALDALKHQQKRAEEERQRAALEQQEKEKRAEMQRKEQEEAQRRQEEARKREAEAKAKAEAEQRAAAPTGAGVGAPSAPTTTATPSGFNAAAVYKQSMDLLALIKNKIETGGLDDSAKRDYMRTIHLSVQQISAVREQVAAKINVLCQLIQRASAREVEKLFCLDLIAQKIVQQGDSQVHVHIHSAFPIADVAVALCTLVPELTPILVAKFHEKCCYTVPYYIPKAAGQSDQDHLFALGYMKKQAGIELEESYNERMAGFMALYAAFMQSDPFQGKPHPHGIDKAWSWMARVLNMKPRRITATLLEKFLQVAGHAMRAQYGRQFFKMLMLIHNHTLPTIDRLPNKHVPSLARLQIFIKEVDATHMANLNTPEGRSYD